MESTPVTQEGQCLHRMLASPVLRGRSFCLPRVGSFCLRSPPFPVVLGSKALSWLMEATMGRMGLDLCSGHVASKGSVYLMGTWRSCPGSCHI